LPGVAHVAPGFVVTGAPLARDGSPRIRVSGLAYPVASVNGLFFSQDRLAVNEGRLADPRRPDEIVMAPVVARLLGFHVGQVVPFGFYTQAQTSAAQFGRAPVRPTIAMRMKLVGLASLSSEVVQDDVDVLPTFIPLTPAFARQALADGLVGAMTFGIRTTEGSATVPAVERELAGLIPPGLVYTNHATGPVAAKADRSLEPIAIALAVFGGVALLATFLIAVQLMGRRLRSDAEETRTLRALGAGPADVLVDGMLGLELAVVAGGLGALGAAVALSAFTPLGPVRPVDPDRGLSWDWTVLGFGFLALLLLLSASAVLLARLAAPHRTAGRVHLRSTSGARAAATLARAGLPAPGVVGTRWALEPGSGRTAVPVRSVLGGAVLAVALVVTTVTFGSSLHTLVSTPSLYGWNWSYTLNPVGSGGGDVPQVALSMLRHDPDVAAYAGASYNSVEVDGQTVPFLMESDRASVGPPILSGHGVGAPHQAVLGAATLAQLHARVGQDVTVSYGTPGDAPLYIPPTKVSVVGTATFPAVGFASTVSDHTSMGTGILLPAQVLPPSFVGAIDGGTTPALTGPNLALVRMRPDVAPAVAVADLERIAQAADRAFADAPGGSAGNGVVVQGVQRPAEIVNYRSMGSTPFWLVSGLVLGAVVALALTLVSSVHQRRRDLALLKTVGFVRSQLGATVAWQASVAALIGIAVGVPLGVVAGRWLWNLFAEQIYAVPYPSVPVTSVVLVALGTLVLANLVAAWPAWRAARTPTALMLRAE
jgi:hypothetical protein